MRLPWREGLSLALRLVVALCAVLRTLWVAWWRGISGDSARDYKAPLRLGLSVCAFVLLGFGGWSVLASVSGAVVAVGKVSVEGQVRILQHVDGGVVSEILVRDGDAVVAGDVLLRLDAVGLQAELSILQSRLREALARRARLEAERDNRTSPQRPRGLDLATRRVPKPDKPAPDVEKVADVDGVSTKGDFELVSASSTEQPSAGGELLPDERPEGKKDGTFEAEVRLFHARQATREAQIQRLYKSIEQAREQIIGLEGQGKARRRQRELITQELGGARELHEKGLAPLTRVLGLERQLSEIDGSVAGVTAEIAAIGQKIGQFEVEILTVGKDWQESVLVDLRAANLEVRELLERQTSLSDKLRRIDLRAPVSGTVNNLSAHTVGGVIRAADPVLEIVPSGQLLAVEALVRPAEIDRLYRGQLAQVRFSAFDAGTTPVLDGAVVHVSADLIEDREIDTSGYLVRVSIAESELARLQEKQLIPGMPVELFLKTGSRSPISYLLKPLTDQFARSLNER